MPYFKSSEEKEVTGLARRTTSTSPLAHADIVFLCGTSQQVLSSASLRNWIVHSTITGAGCPAAWAARWATVRLYCSHTQSWLLHISSARDAGQDSAFRLTDTSSLRPFVFTPSLCFHLCTEIIYWDWIKLTCCAGALGFMVTSATARPDCPPTSGVLKSRRFCT